MKKDFRQAGQRYLFGDFMIFLDMDGVIADFDAHVDAHNQRLENGRPNYDAFDREWYATIPVFKGADSFFSTLKMLAPVKFLTAPTRSADCYAGKADWIMNQFLPKEGKWALKDLIISPKQDKCLLAGAKRILIDDSPQNIAQWEDAGGIGILHEGDFQKTFEALCEAIECVRNHDWGFDAGRYKSPIPKGWKI